MTHFSLIEIVIIYGPTQDIDEMWRRKTNEELETLIKKQNIVSVRARENFCS